MPNLPNENENFIHGLSDFWVRFFADTAEIQAFTGGAQVLVGQAYLELLQTVLGTSLEHMPLFDRKYFQLLQVREDQIAFLEGPSTDDDRYAHQPFEAVADLPVLTNRVIAPTAVLDEVADYTVRDTRVHFVRDPFNYTAPDETIPGFPVRYVNVTTAADLTEPYLRNWMSFGVKPGDALRARFYSGQDNESVVTSPQAEKLVLATAETNFKLDFHEQFTSRRLTLSVLRVPWDTEKNGIPLIHKTTGVTSFAVFSVGGTSVTGIDNPESCEVTITAATTLTSPQAVASWVGRWLLVRDPVNPGNDGLFLVTGVAGTTVTVVALFPVFPSGPFTAYIGDAPSGVGIGHFMFLVDAVNPANNGYFKIVGFIGNSYTVTAPNPLVAATVVDAHRVAFFDVAPTEPTFPLPNQEITKGTLLFSATRLFARVVNGVTYPVGENVIEDVDYAIDYTAGTLTYLSIWNPLQDPRVSYRWRLKLYEETLTFVGEWQIGTAYPRGTIVRVGAKYFLAIVPLTNPASFDLPEWQRYGQLFHFDEVFSFREIALWAPDALIDRDLLYLNFGYLLSYRQSTSELYRRFLQGVAQLFLLGPTIERMESALNVAAFLPVIREDGEILKAYNDGFEILGGAPLAAATGSEKIGNQGELVDANYGNTGVLDNGTSTFTVDDPLFQGAWSLFLAYQVDDVVLYAGKRWKALVVPTVGLFITTEWLEQLPLFFPEDTGVVIETQTPAGAIQSYAVTAVSPDGYTATVTPVPPVTTTNVRWAYNHNAVRRRFTVRSMDVTYAFSLQDVGAYLQILNAREDRNQQMFRIASVAGPRSVYLEADYPLIDETGLTFKVSRQQVQEVTTDKHFYTLPIDVPIRDVIADPASIDTYELHAFEPLSDAIRVIDYVRDPTWWHNVTIPKEVLQLVPESPLRRQVSPVLIDHLINALDASVYNDFGRVISADDEGQPGIPRQGTALWLGGPWVKLTFAATTPLARPNDVNRYLHVRTPDFEGDFQILEVTTDGTQVRLDRFPPPEASAYVPPTPLSDVELPPLLYRRTVAFVMMDRFLKYHALNIELRTLTLLTSRFLSDVLSLVRQAKPGYTFVYLEPLTSFTDTAHLREALTIAYGPWIVELLQLIDNQLMLSTGLLINEYYSYHRFTQAGVLVGGPQVIVLAPVFPFAPDRFFLTFARFTAGTADGGRPLSEGINYSVDYATSTITIPNGDAGAYTLEYIALALRVPGVLPSPWYAGVNSSLVGQWYAETPVAINGSDPMIRVNLGMLAEQDQGLIDRSIQISVT